MASTRIRRHVRHAVLVIGVTFLIAACTSGDAGATATPAASTAASATTAPSASARAGGYGRGDYGSEEGNDDYGASPPASASADTGTGSGASAIAVATGAVGSYLTGDGGLTLYTFDRDSTNSSACDGDCATNWPPFTVEGDQNPTAGAGVTGTITLLTRADGSRQVAYNGRPLYFFAGDSAPGETSGQGLNDVWFVAGP